LASINFVDATNDVTNWTNRDVNNELSNIAMVAASLSAEVRCPRNSSHVFADDWATVQCMQHQEHLSVGAFYDLFLQHPSVERFDMLCRYK